uniref:Early nodulin-40 n=2 Tax=Lotus japonicus TaxID=34305 RepID=NO40_LOTJA|nr:RecName: Full=Early nodulin-40 [Lotus japonicus]AAB82785.1 early nodulin [Lotus japonicus]CAB92979.1 ENOD40-2 protein [Lotus japonicus]
MRFCWQKSIHGS